MGAFENITQFGADLAVIGFHAGELLARARAVPRDQAIRRFWFSIAIAFLPAASANSLLRDWIKAVLFASPAVIAWSLIGGGVILIAVERVPQRPPASQGLL